MTSLESFSQAGEIKPWSLIIDTSSFEGSLTVLNCSGKTLKVISWGKEQRHTEVLLKNFKKILQSFDKKKLIRVYFVQGPGSFTGLRVSAAFVKSITFALGDIPITCISSFLEVAQNIIEQHKDLDEFTVVIPSIRNKLFSAKFKLSGEKWEESIDMSGAHEKTGELINHFSSHPQAALNYPDIKLVKKSDGDLGKAFLNKDKILYYFQNKTYLDLHPLYLRQSEAEEKLRYDKAKL